MDLAIYDKIIDSINDKPFDYDKTLHELCLEFDSERASSLRSILSQEYQRQVKARYKTVHHPDNRKAILQEFVKRVQDGENPAIIVDIAKRLRTSAALVARIVLEEHLNSVEDKTGVAAENLGGKSDNGVKCTVAKYMRDTSLVEDRDLSYEVFLATVKDDSYGPLAEAIKHSIGEQHEQIIKDRLKELDIPFVDEHVLRSKGYDKTPDVKLEIPVAVNGKVINWIESKALFGDSAAHEGYLRDQFWSYWNRFGPGLVIYWFGYIKQLDNNVDRGIVLMDRFPDNITYFKPEGCWRGLGGISGQVHRGKED